MCFEVGRVNRDRLIVAGFGSQRHHDPREHPHVAPSLPAVVEGLVNTIFFRCITPPQAVAIYEYNSDQHAAIIDARHTMALREIGPKPCHLIFAQPVKIASLNHNGQIAPSGLMGPGSRRGVCGVTVMAEMPRGGGQPGRGRRPAAHLHPAGPAAVEISPHDKRHRAPERGVPPPHQNPPCCPAPKLLWALVASGQTQMRKVDGWEALGQPIAPISLDLAA